MENYKFVFNGNFNENEKNEIKNFLINMKSWNQFLVDQYIRNRDINIEKNGNTINIVKIFSYDSIHFVSWGDTVNISKLL